jgi:uncharacterized protein
MEMEGVVTNVTDFGAFVDVGVHQDGLVHLSELANRFVRDPREVIKVGEIVKVRVIKVDKTIRRISLSMKALQPPPRARAPRPARTDQTQAPQGEARESAPARRRETTGPPDGRPPRTERKDARRGSERKREHSDRKPAQRRDAPIARKAREPEEKLNTQLADQLAALREKFNQR